MKRLEFIEIDRIVKVKLTCSKFDYKIYYSKLKAKMSDQPATDKPTKVSDLKETKRILITSVNGLLGHSLFELMRNDHIAMTAGADTAHRFLGTFNSSPTGGIVNASPSDAIKLLDSAAKPKTFEKQVRNADFIVLDISQFSASLEEAQRTLKALKYHEAGLAPEKP